VEAVTGEKTPADARTAPAAGPKLTDYFRSSGREERVA
jgi:hypothetical protein